MSRQIRNDHPWTEDEIKYQLARNRWREVEKNRKMFPPGSKPIEQQEDSPTLELDADIFDFVNGLSVPQLKSELRKLELEPTGDEKTLKVKLAQVLQAERDNEDQA